MNCYLDLPKSSITQVQLNSIFRRYRMLEQRNLCRTSRFCGGSQLVLCDWFVLTRVCPSFLSLLHQSFLSASTVVAALSHIVTHNRRLSLVAATGFFVPL
ncbi:unnamed protein product, partial [Citrullus colocynthis]